MMTDPIADMLTRIRNAVSAKKDSAAFPYSKVKFTIAQVLVQQGFLQGTESVRSKPGNQEEILVRLKYDHDQTGPIRQLKRISTPGHRRYLGYRDMPRLVSRKGITILSTPQGIMSHQDAYKRKLGGEIICEVY